MIDVAQDLINGIQAQRDKGLRKYGVPVVPSVESALYWLGHHTEELTDALVYSNALMIRLREYEEERIRLQGRVHNLEEALNVALIHVKPDAEYRSLLKVLESGTG